MPDGTYAYFATPAFPYLLGCFGPGHVRRPPTGPDAVLMQEQEEEGSATAPFEGGPLPALLEEEAGELAYTNSFPDPSSPTGQLACPAGTFASSRTFGCQPCPAGRYGLTPGLTSKVCSGA